MTMYDTMPPPVLRDDGQPGRGDEPEDPGVGPTHQGAQDRGTGRGHVRLHRWGIASDYRSYIGHNLACYVECENPNPKLDSFLGRLTVWTCKDGHEPEVISRYN